MRKATTAVDEYGDRALSAAASDQPSVVRTDDARPVTRPALDDDRLARTLFRGASVAVSLALHVGAAAAMFVWLETQHGATSAPTEAITIELIASEVIETAAPAPVSATSAVAKSPDALAGSIDEAAARQEQNDPDPVAKSSTEHTKGETSLVGEASRETAALSETPATDAAAPAPPEDPQVTLELPAVAPELPSPPPPKKEQAVEPAAVAASTKPISSPKAIAKRAVRAKSKASAPSQKGGAPSRAVRGSKNAAARASASTGAAMNYASIVRARVAANRPSGQGRRGSILVTFSVSPSGGLAFASITRSSGDRALDASVLSAVRSAAPFPPPPAGASQGQRRFVMPFDFH